MKKLSIELQSFEQICQDAGYIQGSIEISEISHCKPMAFIVTMIANKKWVKKLSECKKARCSEALYVLMGIFYSSTKAKVRKSIYVLIVKNSGQKGDQKLYGVNPDLTVSQIRRFYNSKNFSAKHAIRKYLETGRLNVQQICNIFATNDDAIISHLMKRCKSEEKEKYLIEIIRSN